jgi:ring-1,2-phenylacetyl-CoA epoxidase subunit PaaD
MTLEAREKLRAYGITPPQAARHGNVVELMRRRPPSEAPCPHCGSAETTETSHFGSTACKALYKCLNCMEPFDYFKPY